MIPMQPKKDVTMYDKCSICGTLRGYHHYETQKCPVMEKVYGALDRRIAWADTVFTKKGEKA